MRRQTRRRGAHRVPRMSSSCSPLAVPPAQYAHAPPGSYRARGAAVAAWHTAQRPSALARTQHSGDSPRRSHPTPKRPPVSLDTVVAYRERAQPRKAHVASKPAPRPWRRAPHGRPQGRSRSRSFGALSPARPPPRWPLPLAHVTKSGAKGVLRAALPPAISGWLHDLLYWRLPHGADLMNVRHTHHFLDSPDSPT